ncbi:Werner syndrome ATP-dependent helicase [Grifola frondosa]|uniref:DNA 3'-5' helicase n=1 Tax=Grifola frondosa TaxID=5627 RepID=A0A1C7M4T9_GRIFR|nr:Werner syndrome ATP-dependent helicase [Grifola frondosa]
MTTYVKNNSARELIGMAQEVVKRTENLLLEMEPEEYLKIQATHPDFFPELDSQLHLTKCELRLLEEQAEDASLWAYLQHLQRCARDHQYHSQAPRHATAFKQCSQLAADYVWNWNQLYVPQGQNLKLEVSIFRKGLQVVPALAVDSIREKSSELLGCRPCLWQANVTQALLRRDKDVMCVAGTGSGKMLTFWMLLLFRPNDIQIVITPLNILAETATVQNWKDIEDGKYHAVVINPNEALKENRGCKKLWKNVDFTSRLISVTWDEGHCVSAWGHFRPEYKDAGRLRYMIPKDVPYYVPSATLPDDIRKDIMNTLRMDPAQILLFQHSNDCPNIHLTVRKIKHAQSSFEDLAFLIPEDWKPGDKLPKFLVFFDSIDEDKIKWFNSDMMPQFREQATSDYKEDKLCELYCTDSFGMGVDIPDIEIVVQWRVTCDVNTLWQRFRHAAHRPDLFGTAVLFAEAKYFDDEKEKKKESAAKAAAKKQAGTKRKATECLPAERPVKQAIMETSARLHDGHANQSTAWLVAEQSPSLNSYGDNPLTMDHDMLASPDLSNPTNAGNPIDAPIADPIHDPCLAVQTSRDGPSKSSSELSSENEEALQTSNSKSCN